MIDALQHVLEQVEHLEPAVQETLAKRFQAIIKEELGKSAGGATKKERYIQDLGWTEAQAQEVRANLQSFEEDWSAPGMDAYDEL
jgi:hypothetical protein